MAADRPNPPSPESSEFENNSHDPTIQQEVQRLHQLTLYGRWCGVAALWAIILPLSLWGLRYEIALWLDYFTWAAVRYGLAYTPWSALGLLICLMRVLVVSYQELRYRFWGLSTEEQEKLTQRIWQMRKQGPSHPLWRWVHRR